MNTKILSKKISAAAVAVAGALSLLAPAAHADSASGTLAGSISITGGCMIENGAFSLSLNPAGSSNVIENIPGLGNSIVLAQQTINFRAGCAAGISGTLRVAQSSSLFLTGGALATKTARGYNTGVGKYYISGNGTDIPSSQNIYFDITKGNCATPLNESVTGTGGLQNFSACIKAVIPGTSPSLWPTVSGTISFPLEISFFNR
jgi:hypothetical protein